MTRVLRNSCFNKNKINIRTSKILVLHFLIYVLALKKVMKKMMTMKKKLNKENLKEWEIPNMAMKLTVWMIVNSNIREELKPDKLAEAQIKLQK